jgi:uncharacterized membrane protein YccC
VLDFAKLLLGSPLIQHLSLQRVRKKTHACRCRCYTVREKREHTRVEQHALNSTARTRNPPMPALARACSFCCAT